MHAALVVLSLSQATVRNCTMKFSTTKVVPGTHTHSHTQGHTHVHVQHREPTIYLDFGSVKFVLGRAESLGLEAKAKKAH